MNPTYGPPRGQCAKRHRFGHHADEDGSARFDRAARRVVRHVDRAEHVRILEYNGGEATVGEARRQQREIGRAVGGDRDLFDIEFHATRVGAEHGAVVRVDGA